MPSINKQSLRQEFDQLKAKFDGLSNNGKISPNCDMSNKGHFPEDMPGPLQYGPGIKGYVVNLLIAQMVLLKRVQQMIQTLIGQILSEATILKYVIQLYAVLERWEQYSIEQLLKTPSMHVNQTTFYQIL